MGPSSAMLLLGDLALNKKVTVSFRKEMKRYTITFFTELLCRLNEIMNAKDLAQCLEKLVLCIVF